MKLIIALTALLSLAYAARITSLPDYSGPELSMYGGYVEVNSTNTRNIFYWLIESEKEAQEKPLYVWFQGGPGCSGLAGLFTENGPIRFINGKPTFTDLGWTKFANMLYIEQPACVGFSYTDDCATHNQTGDFQAAHDNYNFITRWLQQPEFSHYIGRDTYFGGESYGGVYIPTLTNLVLSDSSTQIYSQFKGFAVGNPVMSCQGGFIGTNGNYSVETFNLLYWHGLVSYTNKNNWTNVWGCDNPAKAGSDACQWILNNAMRQVGPIVQPLKKRDTAAPKVWPSLDPDDIYFDFCTGNGTMEFSLQPNKPGTCNSIGNELVTYLNRADVQAAIHARAPQSGSWGECANIDYKVSGENMVPLYDNFPNQKAGVKVLVYSGDVDILTVPFAYTMPCFEQFSDKGRQLNEWQPWYVNYATAGYFEQYEKYMYATLKGAGHEAPEYQPLNAFWMIERFIKSGNLQDPATVGGMPSGQRLTRSQASILRQLGLAHDLPWLN